MPTSLRFGFQDFIAQHPLLFQIWYGVRRRYRPLRANRQIDLVIEGYPRCANSFAVVAFERAQNRPIKIAHHLHAEAQIIIGARYRIPILVLIRNPADAITSLITRHPTIGIAQAIRRYIKFYQSVQSLSDQLVIADFSEIVNRYASVIQRLNHRFATHYALYNNAPEADERIFAILDHLNRKDAGGKERMVARPTKVKSRYLDLNRGDVVAHPLLAEADCLYKAIVTKESTTADDTLTFQQSNGPI